MHYHLFENFELRDKYIDLAIEKGSTDQNLCYLRGLQNKPELIPVDVIERELSSYTEEQNWSQRARFYMTLGKYKEAATDYVRGVNESLEQESVFSEAFYLKELANKGLIEELFILALKKATEEGDLWWQVRALQELEWTDQIDSLILEKAEEIERSGDSHLNHLLASVRGDKVRLMEIIKSDAQEECS